MELCSDSVLLRHLDVYVLVRFIDRCIRTIITGASNPRNKEKEMVDGLCVV